ncbi:sugar ABC transporter permease [Herbiconiux moechotypicola]|uniref:Sugar ABC transporter permease n=1 Tax=Herbiconiux moechotypicola TaxID=637393 RepID=A0ABP5QNE0_9MICO
MNRDRLVHYVFEYGIVVVLAVLVLVFSLSSPSFFTASTLTTILSQVSVIGIIAIGMACVMLLGSIDLSVGATAGLVSVTAALLMSMGFPVWSAVILTLIVGIVIGLFNALSLTLFRIPSLIGTLAVMTALRGLAYLLSNGIPIYDIDAGFKQLAQGSFLSIPIPGLLFLGIFVVVAIVLNRAKIGRQIYGVGGNEEASRLSGVPVTRIKYFVFALSGLLAAVGGLLLLARTNSGQPSAGSGYELDVITAVVLGGVAITGGKGRLWLVLVGVLIMGTLSTGMVMNNVNDYVQQVVKGLILVAAVAFSQIAARSQGGRTITR